MMLVGRTIPGERTKPGERTMLSLQEVRFFRRSECMRRMPVPEEALYILMGSGGGWRDVIGEGGEDLVSTVARGLDGREDDMV